MVAAACRSLDAPVDDERSTSLRDGGSAEAEALRIKVARLSEAAQRVVARTDEALWSHWTEGVPLELSEGDAGISLTPESLRPLRRAREIAADDLRVLKHLESFIVGALLARGVAEENAVWAQLEASLTCAVDGKEQRFRELNRQLVNEKSALKRKALWAACLKTAQQLDAALARRDAKVTEVLASLEVPSALDFDTESRELDLEVLAKVAQRLLELTDAAWHVSLRELSDNELKLPVEALSRPDLPRLLKVPAAVDSAFPKAQIAARALATLGTLGLYGRPGLTLDLAEATKKNPLPLTVAPKSNDVRVSFRPLGGLRDQSLLLSELGTALALLSSKTGRFETSRLGDPAIAQVSGALFSSLLGEDAWLEEIGVSDRAAVRSTWRAQQLFALRKAAGTVLARLELTELPEADTRARFVTLMTRVLGVKVSVEDGVRLRLDTDDFLRSATLLRSMLLAATLRHRLGDGWWQKRESGQTLMALWAKGTSQPAETMLGSLMQGLLVTVPSQSAVMVDAGVQTLNAQEHIVEAKDGGR